MLSHSGAVEGTTPSGVKYPKWTDWLGWVLLSEALAMEHQTHNRMKQLCSHSNGGRNCKGWGRRSGVGSGCPFYICIYGQAKTQLKDNDASADQAAVAVRKPNWHSLRKICNSYRFQINYRLLMI